MIRPMLGTNVDLTKLKYPIYASAKLDGVGVNAALTYTLEVKPDSEMIWA